VSVTQEAERPASAVGRLIARFRHIINELGKFGIVGLVAYVVDIVIFNLCLSVMNTLPAKTVSTVVAATIAFVGNRFWTWRDRPRSRLHREYTLYFVFNAIGLAISLACLWLSHDVLGHYWPSFQTRLADNISAMVFGMALGTLFRFWAYRTYVFIPDPATNQEKARSENGGGE
jgi:putative flippase GtrA